MPFVIRLGVERYFWKYVAFSMYYSYADKRGKGCADKMPSAIKRIKPPEGIAIKLRAKFLK